MTSKRQKKKGYPLPENEFEGETASYCVTIPAGYEFYQALYSQLDELGKWWLWKRDDDRLNAASDTAMTWRNTLTIEENCGGLDMATKEDIRDAIYEATNRLALQLVTGSYIDISLSTDEDGVVTQTPEGVEAVEVPEDDPATPEIDENAASRMGGASAVGRALELFFDKLDSYYGATNGTPTTPAIETKALIKAYFPTDGADMDTAIDLYYTYRGANARFLFGSVNSFEQYLYCNGANEQGFNRWLIDVSGYTNLKIATMKDLVSALSDEFFTQYFATGSASPNTEYRGALCTKIDTEIYTLNFALADSFAIPTGVWKDAHRIEMKAEGSFTDSDNPNIVKDMFWSIDTTTGIKTFEPPTLSHTGTNAITSSQVPYQASHKYSVTIEKTGSNSGTITKTNGAFALPNTTGIVTMTLTDMGQTF